MQIQEIKKVPLYNTQAFEHYVQGKLDLSLSSLKHEFKTQFPQMIEDGRGGISILK